MMRPKIHSYVSMQVPLVSGQYSCSMMVLPSSLWESYVDGCGEEVLPNRTRSIGSGMGLRRFHIYLYGKEFVLYTDHKPLEVIYSPKSKPPRIERWALRLQPYKFRVVHMPGKTNPADVLSRLPLEGQPNH